METADRWGAFLVMTSAVVQLVALAFMADEETRPRFARAGRWLRAVGIATALGAVVLLFT